MPSGPNLFADDLINSIQRAAHERSLVASTDQASGGMGGGMGILPIDAEVLQEMKEEEGWNDKPVIDRVLTALIASGKKKQRPASVVTRVLIVVPTVSEVHVVIAVGFTPIAPEDQGDVLKAGRWTLSYSVSGGAPCVGQGDLIRGREELSHLLKDLYACFDTLRDKFALKAPEESTDGLTSEMRRQLMGVAVTNADGSRD